MSDDEGTEGTSAEILPREGLADRIAEHDEELAEEVSVLVEQVDDLEEQVDERDDLVDDLEGRIEDREERIEELEDRIDDLEGRLKRKQADFENYKKRQKREQERIRERATEDLVERLLDVRDNLRRAAEADHDDVESVREGVKMTLREFDRVLDAEGVVEISPDPGDDVDPQRHEVMMRVDSGCPEGTIAELYAPGYEMGEKVLRAAQVTVSDGPEDGNDTEAEADESEAHGDDESESNDPDHKLEGSDTEDDVEANSSEPARMEEADPSEETSESTGDGPEE